MGKNIKVRTMAQVKDPKEAGLAVVVRGTSPFDFQKALRKFKRKVADSGVLQEIRDREHSVKPSAKRREKKKAAVRRAKRQRLLEELEFSNRKR